MVTPVVVLWATEKFRPFRFTQFVRSLVALAGASLVGLVGFSPLIMQTVQRTSLGFLAVLPLVWAALWCGPRDTATVVLTLAGFAIWGVIEGAGQQGTYVPPHLENGKVVPGHVDPAK